MANAKESAARRACAAIVGIIEGVEIRCAAAEGPVTPTLEEMTRDELRAVYRLAARGARGPKAGRRGAR
jgi:hypothetical protein